MERPDSLLNQQEGKAKAALWARGTGGLPLQRHPCALEPPAPHPDRFTVDVIDCALNDWSGPYEASWWKQLFSTPLYGGQPIRLPQRAGPRPEQLTAITIEQYREDETSIEAAQQFLLSLPQLNGPLAFEISGRGPYPRYDFKKACRLVKQGRRLDSAIAGWHEPRIAIQFVCHKQDAPLLRSQLLLQYPHAAISIAPKLTEYDLEPGRDIQANSAYAATLSLDQPFVFPLASVRYLDRADPLQPALAALEGLGREQLALIQVLLTPVMALWADTITNLLSHPYKPKEPFFQDISPKILQQKFASPLFAVSLRIVASSKATFRQLLGWAQFAKPPQKLVPLVPTWAEDEASRAERDALALAVQTRCTFRPGFIANVEELATFCHLPSTKIPSERLGRVMVRTKRAPHVPAERGSVLLGENLHQGACRKVFLPAELRQRHTWITGKTGMGKSTLLLNMALFDLKQGYGQAIIEPHGDLAVDFLARVPKSRIKDVIYINPQDNGWPLPLNLLHVAGTSEAERERVVADALNALRKQYADSWGPRLAHLLLQIFTTVVWLRGTLRTARRLLLDEDYRHTALKRITHPDLLMFWQQEFPKLPTGALDPVHNKISPFLLNTICRNLLCQTGCLNFDHIINSNKILVCNLSTGALGETVSGLIGSAIVTHLISAAFRRASIPKEKRRPFSIVIDEWQNFTNTNSGIGYARLLSECRKYRVCLTAANQYSSQLPPDILAALRGNIGSVISFGMGSDDARILAKEFDGFDEQDLLALQRGQAVVRMESASRSFNLNTYPEPTRPDRDFTGDIIAFTRAKYARPRKEVEAEMMQRSPKAQKPSPPAKKKVIPKPPPPLPNPPDLDDLVS